MDKNTTYREWLAIVPFTDFEMQEYKRPFKVGGKDVPENLNDLTIGQLIRLSAKSDDMFYTIPQVVLGMSRKEVEKARAMEVVSLISWVTEEVQKINKLFEAASPKPTEIEKRAGIGKLQFGLFGMLDYYALRMGITDHDEVLGVSWMRIYKCIDMDNKKAQYQKKLQEEMLNDYRRKNTRSRK